MFLQHGETPLYIAAHQGHLEICQELIQRGASIDRPQEVCTSIFSTTDLCHEASGNSSKKVLEDARFNWYKVLVLATHQWCSLSKSPEPFQELRRS